MSGNFAEMATSTPFRELLHAAKLRHETDGYTSPPKEGVLRIFFVGGQSNGCNCGTAKEVMLQPKSYRLSLFGDELVPA